MLLRSNHIFLQISEPFTPH